MQLFYSPASPFARKVRVLIREKNIAGVEEIALDAVRGDERLNAANPIAQVPALVDEAGVCWTDSPLICARLDAIFGAPKLIPEGDARWHALRREVIADSALEVGVKLRLESLRPEGERSSTWPQRWRASLMRALDSAEREALSPDVFDIGSIASVCALTWIDFRHADLNWRNGRPKLAALQEALEQRESFRATKPA